jgi:hypothetical protein
VGPVAWMGSVLTAGQGSNGKPKPTKGFLAMRKSIDDRIADKYTPVPFSGCWIWLASTTAQGYGQIYVKNRMVLVHVYLWEQMHGAKPPGMELDHAACDTTFCINPDHLRLVSHRDNMLRGSRNVCAINARKTHCKMGHELAGDNLILKDRYRYCRACRKAWQQVVEARRKAGIYQRGHHPKKEKMMGADETKG